MVVVPTGKKLPVGTPVRVTFSEAGQLSLVVGVPNSVSPMTRPHDPAVSAGVSRITSGGAVMVGGVVSGVVTVVEPTGKNVPEAGEVCVVPQSPDVSMLPAKFTTAPGSPL